jgi:dihydrofolate reductase
MENLDESDEWRLVADSDEQTYFDLEYYFQKYEKVSITD